MLTQLAHLRIEKGYKIRQLGELAGVSKSTVHNIENGNVIPGIDMVCKLARALEMEPAELFSTLVEGEDY